MEQSPGSGLRAHLVIDPEVAEALDRGTPVVALESTLISHGLPYPQNVAVARASEAAIRSVGAIPATIAIHAGMILVGLDGAALEALATAPAGAVYKAARPSLAVALVGGGWAATTVSASMIAAHAAGIRVFATGGIGGVHRGAFGAAASLDVSSDLEELARTPVAVVCAGPKAILDLALTLEFLETRGVPVVALGQDDVPGFYSIDSGIRAPHVAGDISDAARIASAHLGLGLGSGILLCAPVPAAAALPGPIARAAIERAIAEAGEARIEGPAVTPWLLARVAELTDGASIRANTALIEHNALVAGQLAMALSER